MEKTKDQILIGMLRKAGRKTRMGMGCPHHGMPPVPGMPPMHGHHGPHGHCRHGMPPEGGMMPPPPMPPHGFGMMPREIILTTVLDLGEDGVRQKDIASELGINASSLSEQLDRLEDDNYIERKANPEDKRSTLIALTEKGKARAFEVQDERQKAAADFCSKLTEEEKDTLIALLDKLIGE